MDLLLQLPSRLSLSLPVSMVGLTLSTPSSWPAYCPLPTLRCTPLHVLCLVWPVTEMRLRFLARLTDSVPRSGKFLQRYLYTIVMFIQRQNFTGLSCYPPLSALHVSSYPFTVHQLPLSGFWASQQSQVSSLGGVSHLCTGASDVHTSNKAVMSANFLSARSLIRSLTFLHAPCVFWLSLVKVTTHSLQSSTA